MTAKFWLSSHGLLTLLLTGAALYFLFIEHGEHVYPFLPYLVLLLCPLMHVFMHQGHGGHGRPGEGSKEAYSRGLEEGRKQAERFTHDDNDPNDHNERRQK